VGEIGREEEAEDEGGRGIEREMEVRREVKKK